MSPPAGPVLALNAGSSSLKATLYDAALAPLARALVERVGEEGATLTLTGARDVKVNG